MTLASSSCSMLLMRVSVLLRLNLRQSQSSGDALPPGVRYLHARFTNGALAAFEQG